MEKVNWKWQKFGVFFEPENRCQTVLPDRSILIRTKIVQKFKWNNLRNFQTNSQNRQKDEIAKIAKIVKIAEIVKIAKIAKIAKVARITKIVKIAKVAKVAKIADLLQHCQKNPREGIFSNPKKAR